MKNILATLRLLVLRFQAYSLAITLAGRAECFDLVRDPLTLANMDRAQDITRRELRRVQAEMGKLIAARQARRERRVARWAA